MKIFLVLSLLLTVFAIGAFSQTKTNDVMARQIRSLGSQKSIELTYDQASNVSKLKGVTGNFADAGKAGVQAMNFAVGFMYPGTSIDKAPGTILLSFWVLTKRPRFAENHTLVIGTGTDRREVGPARYAAKPRENMEYLNFDLSREELAKLAGGSPAIRLGDYDLSLTRGQQKVISDVLAVSDPAR